MALFSSEVSEALKRLAAKSYATQDERDELLRRVESSDLRARDVVWMLFRPDRAMRDTAARVLLRVRDAETLDVFLGEVKGKPEQALRAAAAAFFALGFQGIDARFAQLLAPPVKETKETRELQEATRRLLAEAPMSRQVEPLLWQLALAGSVDERMPFLNRLAAAELDENGVKRWRRLAAEPDPAVRDKAIEVLATRVPQHALDLLIEALPRAGYALQQIIVDAMMRAAAGQGVAFAERLLPALASGDAGTRTAVLKILMGIGDPAGVIKRYIRFSSTLAGFVRDRSLDSLREFGPALVDPVIELLQDDDPDIRSGAIAVATGFDDIRIVPATIQLLRDPDWWIRLSAADTLGRMKDPRAVEPLVAALGDAEIKRAAIESLGRIGDPRALPALGRMLADPSPDVRIEVMLALKHFKHPQVLNAITSVAQTDQDRAVRTHAVEILDELAQSDKSSQVQMDAIRKSALAVSSAKGEARLNTLLIATRNQGASDFHLSVGQPPIVRLAADLLRAQGEPFTAAQTEAMLREVLSEKQWSILEAQHQIDFCYVIQQGGRYRANVFFDQSGYNGVFRVIPEKPPTIVELGLPAHLAEISDYHQGLVLVCGPSGSGKSTTLAALVNLFNETRSDHILTMEDPVEFVHPFKNCLVNQREVGSATVSFARALRAALREDPDVIVIGELRDNESITLALTAAETGHIVLGTLNSTSAPKAIDRILSSFPADEQPQIRASLSESLKYCVAQRLLPAKEGRRQVAAFEVLKGTSNIGTMIRDEKTYQIYSAMQIGRSLGMQTFDEALKDLLRRDQISAETAYMAALKKEDFESMVSADFIARGKA
ncbi:MAG TPA: PilT/PilU family type 4a pilus ATPase [Thermoanaerobaculia bacterium]|jgi:twitching motility protein PilT|nr:PilT/PilU family type 4a pilus ATPase [Thermoanaerobaculia bacterium]